MKPDTLENIALCIEGATGVIGGSLVLSNEHPYLSLLVLALGAASTKLVNKLEKNKRKKNQHETANYVEQMYKPNQN
jgi:hypothetical protein